MNTQQTSSASSFRQLRGTAVLNLSQNPFTRLQSGDYKQLSIEQAQRMAQNLQPVQSYTDQVVFMSWFI